MIPLLTVEQRWGCPNCMVKEVTHDQPNRFHLCGGLKGMVAPLILDGVKAKVEAVERQDYLGHEKDNVTYNGDNRPIMSVVTTRDDGIDCAVMAPVATGRVRA